MKILNLYYERAFNHLMDNDEAAKAMFKIILIKEKIHSFKRREIYRDLRGVELDFGLYCFDVLVETEEGIQKNIILELQKFQTESLKNRFRSNLIWAQKDQLEHLIISTYRGPEPPLFTVYMFNFLFDGINRQIVKSKQKLYGQTENEEIKLPKDKPESIFLSSYLITTPKINNEDNKAIKIQPYCNFFKLFEHKTQDQKAPEYIIEIDETQINDDRLKTIINYLNRATTNNELIDKLKEEKEIINNNELVKNKYE